MKKQKRIVGIRIAAVLMSFLMAFTSIPAMSILALADEISSHVIDISPRLTLNFNKNWKFNYGDVANAQSTAFSDKSWRSISLPHDFSIEQEFTLNGTEGESGSLPGGTGWYRKSFTLPVEYSGKSVVINFGASYCETTVYVNGEKIGENFNGYNSFSFDVSDYLYFDGETANVIAVKVVNNIPSSRWYSGSGLIGDVTLSILNPVHVSLYGVQVTTPDLAASNGTDGTTNVNIIIHNNHSTNQDVTVTSAIYSSAGVKLAEDSHDLSLITETRNDVSLSMDISNPALWSTTSPSLYTMKTTVVNSAGNTIDEYYTTYGYTWSSFDKDTGFYLNGQPLKLQGVCMHLDQGGLGAAQEYDAIYRQISILKEMGVNAIRGSHNVFPEMYIQICNELGMIFIEEFFDGWYAAKNGNTYSFHQYFDEYIKKDNQVIGGEGLMWYQFVAQQTVMRDRNNPCIPAWDVGNELNEADDAQGKTVAADLKNKIAALDSRPIFWGNDKGGIKGIDAYMDIFGGNYKLSTYRGMKDSFNKPFIATESASAVGSRGFYKNSYSQSANNGVAYSANYQINAYDASNVDWGNTAADAWYYTIINDWFSGEFVWTGFDYIGEPTPWNAHDSSVVKTDINAPNSSFFGIIDTAGFEKDSYYLYNSLWDKSETTLHIVPGTWNRSNLVVDSSGYVDVAIYTNAPYVELLYNGTVVGKAYGKTNTTTAGNKYITYSETAVDTSKCKVGTISGSNDHELYPIFDVKYDANATITLKAYDREGGTEITNTAGTKKLYANSAASIKVAAWNGDTTLTADSDSFNYIEITALDANGNFANDYNGTLNVTLSSNQGAGVIAAVDNGNATNNNKFQSSTALLSDTSASIQMFNGKALVIVQSTEKAGSINVTVTPSDLPPNSIGLTSETEKGDKLRDEFEEVVDQSVDLGKLDDDERYQFLSDAINGLTAPKTDVTYELYEIGSGREAFVPSGSYVITGADTSGTVSTGALTTSAANSSALQTSGRAADSSSQIWYFTRLSNGKYTISYSGVNITNEYLSVSADGVKTVNTAVELTVTYTGNTVTIADKTGTYYVTYSASNANTAGVSSNGTALKLYSAENGTIKRWGDVGLVEDGQYVIYSVIQNAPNRNTGFVLTPTPKNVNSWTGFDRAEVTPVNNVITTDTANEVVITKIEDSDEGYTVRLESNKYLDIITTDNCLLSSSTTPTELKFGEGKVAYDNNIIIYEVNSSGKAYLLNHFSGEKFFCQYTQNIVDANGSNELMTLYRRVDSDSSANISLYDALVKAIAVERSSYTTESYAELLDAIQNGYEKFTSPTATDAEKNAATSAIDTAYDNLEKNFVSETLKDDISNLEAPKKVSGGYYRYDAKSGTPVPDGEYILYATDLSGSSKVMSGVPDSNGNIKGFMRADGTLTNNGSQISIYNNADACEWKITYNAATGKYTLQHGDEYLNIEMNDVTVTLSAASVEMSITPLSDNRVNIHNSNYYLQNQDTIDHPIFSNWKGNGGGNHEKITLFRKEYSFDNTHLQPLYDALMQANEIDPTYYTAVTYAALLEAMQDGYNTYINEAATESEINGAVQAIKVKIDGLKYTSLRPMLQQQISALTPPQGSYTSYRRYTAKHTSGMIIPEGDYVISGYFDTSLSPTGAYGVMTKNYVEDGSWYDTWTGLGWAASYSDPTTDSPTWHISRNATTGYYYISRTNASNQTEYVYTVDTKHNCRLSGAVEENPDNRPGTEWEAIIEPDTMQVRFKNVDNPTHYITFLGDYAWERNEVSDDVRLYVSSYNNGGTPLTLQRIENGQLVDWYTVPIEDGKYIVTQYNDIDSTQVSNNVTEIMDITNIPRNGTFGERSNIAISNDIISTESDYELTFTRVSGSVNKYYVRDSRGYWLRVGTYLETLSFTTSQTELVVETDTNGNVYITSTYATKYYINHDSSNGLFDTATVIKNYNSRLRLFRLESEGTGAGPRLDLYNKLLEAIAIEQGFYSEESYHDLLIAIKEGVDAYKDDNGNWQAATDAIAAAIDALEIARAGFAATLYKYGYTPPANDYSSGDYSSGGFDFNNLAYAEMTERIRNNPDLMQQITDIAVAAGGTQFASPQEQQAAVNTLISAYVKIYTLAFSDYAVADTGTKVDQYYKTFWNIWQKAGTKASGEKKNEGASVQGIFSSILDSSGVPTSHTPYASLPYKNHTSGTDDLSNGVDGLTSNVNNVYITKNGSSVQVTLPELENISVYVPDYFSKNDVAGTNEAYAKYYWNLQFPFLQYTNDFGVNTYIYDSADRDRVFQASYDDATHTAEAQLTEKSSAETGAVSGPLVDVNGVPQASRPNKGVGFFPFNNRLDGSNANMTTTEKAIYHFGMSFTTDFYIPLSGTYGDGQDIVFEFSGDDDVLVYIDNVLVLDNGGLHGARSSSINFTDRTVSYQYIADVETGTVTNAYNEGISYTYGEENEGISALNQAAIEYLEKVATDGEQHTFTFFFLERGSTDSNCKISFNIQKLSDYVKLTDETYVVDYGLPVEFDVTKNNIAVAPEGYEIPTYEYIGVTSVIPPAASAGIMFVEPTASDVRKFGSFKELTHAGSFGTFVVNKSGKVKYTPQTMEFTNAGSIYLCAKVEKDATYKEGTVYYAFEKITIVPATTIYYEDDFVGEGITYTHGAIPSTETNTYKHGIWQNAIDTIPTGVVKGSIYQHADAAGSEDANAYGYDGAYSDCATYSGYTSRYVTVSAKNNPDSKYSGGDGSLWPTAEFTFAGTGFDLISVTSKDTGTVNVTVTDVNGRVVRNHTVNTYYGYTYGRLYRAANGSNTLTVTDTPLYFTANRDYTATPTYYAEDGSIVTENTGNLEPAYAKGWIIENAVEDDNALYQIPVIKVEGLDYGTYEITITPMYSSRMDMVKDGAYDFYLDAIRIYNPAGVGDTLTNATISYTYTQDKEANADYLELRDMLIGSNKLTDGTSAEGIIFIDGISENDDVSNYTAGGPNNELYLLKDQAVAFEIWASSIPDDVQIGAKAVGDVVPEMYISYATTAATYTASTEIRTSTDLYYSVDSLLRAQSTGQLNWTPVTGADGNTYYRSGVVVIRNASDGIISVTNLKWTFPSAGIGYFEQLENGSAAEAEEPVMLMSSYSTFAMARSSLRSAYADLEITEDDVAVENDTVSAGEKIVVNVETSSDVQSLVIRDENGSVITPEAIESFTATVDDEEVTLWTVTLTADKAGTFTYTITGAYENGFEGESNASITVTVKEIPSEDDSDNGQEDELSFFAQLVGMLRRLVEFFKRLVAMLTSAVA